MPFSDEDDGTHPGVYVPIGLASVVLTEAYGASVEYRG